MPGSANYLANLRKLISGSFDLSEIRTLCFDLNVDYEDVAGEEKQSRIRELLLVFARRGRLPELVQKLQSERPLVTWPPVPADFELPFEDVAALMAGLNDYAQPKAIASKPNLPFEPGMVLVPAGPFLMGDDDVSLTAPQSTIDLPAYLISLFPITNEQFAEFIHQTGSVASSTLLWDGNRPPRDRLRHPVGGVTWLEALAYCDWLRETTDKPYTLPNEAQWEKAARGADGRLFPWGNEWQADHCNTDFGVITAVDAFPPQSAYGCYDMVGNVREWTSTLWGDSPHEPDVLYSYPWAADGRRDNLRAPSSTRRIFRGGQGAGPDAYRCSTRGHYAPSRSGPRQQRHGFRVVLTD